MYLNEYEQLGFSLNPVTWFKPPTTTTTQPGTTAKQAATAPASSGWFGNLLTNLQTTAGQVVAGKQLYDATRSAFKSGYQYDPTTGKIVPVAPPTPTIKPPAPAPAPIAAPAPAPTPMPTGQRFVPGTTRIQLPTHYMTENQIREIQIALRDRGFDPGPVDGVYGPKTKAGIEAYQAAAGVRVNGVPTGNLLNALRQTSVTSIPTPSQVPTPYTPPVVPAYSGPQSAPVITRAGMPDWALPAAIGGGALILALTMGRGRR